MVFFDPRGVERETVAAPVPYGEYVAQIDKAVAKSKDANSLGVNVFFKILKPSEFLDKSFMDNFNLKNSSKVAEEIGQKKFAGFLDLVGLGSTPLNDPSMLDGKIVKVLLGITPHHSVAGAMKNKVEKYLQVEEADVEGLVVEKTLVDDIPFDTRDVEETPF